MRTLVPLTVFLVAALGACHRKKTRTPFPQAAAALPSSRMEAADFKFGELVKGTPSILRGQSCKKIEAALIRITADAT